MSSLPLLYVVEDDPQVRQLIIRSFSGHPYQLEAFPRGTDLLRAMKARPAKLCIVDLGLPDMDGLALVRRLAEDFACAVIVLTGRQEVSDRILGLELGADDFVVKPFEPRELVARVTSVLRRLNGRTATGDTVAAFAGWRFHVDRHQLVARDGAEVDLSAAEARMLTALLRSPNRILSREQLMPDSPDPATDRSIDVRISRLRSKIEANPREPQIIKTVYGAGYLLAADVNWED